MSAKPVLSGYEPGPLLKKLKLFLVSMIVLSNRSVMEKASPFIIVYNLISIVE